MKIIALISVTFLLSGCANWLMRQQCDKINWFEHGQKVAMRGERLSSDKMVLDCRKAEAEIGESQLDQGFKSGMQKYCSNEQAYLTGKSGDLFSRDLCDGPQINVLLGQHKKGVQDYCAKSNGQQAGASGKKYQNICPKNLEAAFLVEYRKGRKRYVNSMVETRQGEIRELENSINTNRIQLAHIQGRLSGMEREKSSLVSQKNYTPLTNTSHIAYLDSRIQSLDSDISSLRSQQSSENSQISNLESQRNAKLAEIAEFKSELPSLDHE